MQDAGSAAARRGFIAGWLLLCVLKLALAVRLPLFVDEAFYWQEGQHPAWAYSDLPALTAWLARLGVEVFGQHALGLRLPFLLIGAALPWLVVRMAAREFGANSGWQAGLLALLLPLAGSLGLLALPDVPMLLATLLCLDAGLRLLRRVDVLGAGELALGLLLGGLTHYRFVAVIAVGFVGLLMLRDGRHALRHRALWVAVAIGALAWLPLLLWNLRNADAGLQFQLVERHPWRFGGDGFVLGLLQLLPATPLLLAAMALAAWRGLRESRPAARYLALCGSGIVLGFLLLGFFADRERVSFHWPLPGFVALLPLLPAVLTGWPRGWRIATLATAAAGLGLVLGFFLMASVPAWREQTAGHRLYPANFAGWGALAEAVRGERAAMPAGTRLLAGDFKIGAELGFLLADPRIAVLDHPLNHHHGRAPQLALWGLQHDGARDAPMLLVVAATDVKFREELAYFQRLCEQVGPLPPPRVLNIDHGRQRFLLFALPARRGDGACVTPALANIDAPAAGARVERRFKVSAWAAKDVAGVRRVEVLLDGRVVATAQRAGANPWVVDDFLQGRSLDPAVPQVQFTAEVDVRALPAGTHWLGLRVTGSDGAVEDGPEQPVQLR
ncbi:glycosyltransferase family 39 protein [Thermomonas fusca]|uniref:Glycosyltransferase family 39 protein n=1 Tax=Thermomonas fusca TaxID=215690 RepID=A0A5R9PE68_9GAMM|nr:glycosyltransferase family 39 protein [Thermomonas fusca]TLX21804.1 glycosyltransferase family 39 protein [Thermomonas fusca]